MTLFEILPLLSAGLFLIVTLSTMGRPNATRDWRMPALFFLGFLAFSIYAIITEGPLGFWPNHIQNAWGNQVWFDLLIAFGIAWILILPRAKAVSMRLPLWLLFICFSGCIGILAMLARLFYLEGQKST